MTLSSMFTFLYYNGQMITTTKQRTTFLSNYSKSFRVKKEITHDALKKTIKKKLQLGDGKRVVYLTYRCPISFVVDWHGNLRTMRTYKQCSVNLLNKVTSVALSYMSR
ncbi:hypothetical protein CR513_59685, partial [Mucuna pruriens]